MTYGGRLYYNPGLPEVRAFVQDAMCHAVEHYAIDGVHWDDYFYPYPVAGETFDDATRSPSTAGTSTTSATGGGTTSTCWCGRCASGWRN